MKTKLITALRTCAKALEQGTFDYKWERPESCNCGILACSIMGKSIAEMATDLEPMRKQVTQPNWRFLVGRFCPVTGIPQNEIFKALFEAGLSQSDIIELEELSNKKVLSRMTMQKAYKIETIKPSIFDAFLGKKETVKKTEVNYYSSKENTIAYMRAWADILTEEGRLDSDPATETSYNPERCLL